MTGLLVAGLASLFSTTVGRCVLIVAGVVLFYEGLPLGPLRALPIVGPALEDIADGRVYRARREAAATERAAWEEAARRLRAELERARRDAQAAVDAAEAEYLAERQKDALRIAALETAITDMENDDAKNDGAACPDRPAFPRGVSKSLDAIGR